MRFVSVRFRAESHRSPLCESVKETNKKGITRGIRKDQQTMCCVVVSYPNPKKDSDYETWKEKNIEWLKEQYGDDLKTVIEHNDESHPHLHAFILPDDLKCSKYNIGKIAKDDFMKSKEADEIKDNKEKNKCGDRKYKEEWRKWQNDYFEKVGVPCGLTRLGPGRRRLTRDQWNLEQKQAESLKKVISQKNSFVSKTKKEAFSERDKIIQEAKEYAAKILADADQQLAKIKNEISQEEQKLTDIKSHWFVKRLMKNIREEGFTEGIKKSSSQVSKLKKSIKTLKKEKEILIKEKEFSDDMRRKDLISSDKSEQEKQLLKNKISSLISENDKLKIEKEDYKDRWSTLDNSLSLHSSKSNYKK